MNNEEIEKQWANSWALKDGVVESFPWVNSDLEIAIPRYVKMKKFVRADFPFLLNKPGDNRIVHCNKGQIYPVICNSFGAVSAIFPDQEPLGLKPDEFWVIQYWGIENVRFKTAAGR